MNTVYTARYKSPIGMVKITADEHSVTELVFTDDEEAPSETDELPDILAQCLLQLDEFFRGERKEFTIPVNQSGTAFQQKVWNGLASVPYGKTVSYLALSKRLGDAKAIRAVASGNGKNKVSIIVPCHRVVGSDQSLVGYAWGNHRKQWLLQHEAKHANGVQTLF